MIKCGIYIIKNIENGKFYLGSSKEILKRWNRHKNELINNKHHNIVLQRAWNKYTENNFIFEVIKRCVSKNLFKYEQEYLNKYWNSGLLYNISPVASGGDIISNHPNRAQIIEKITKSITERNSKMAKEEKIQKWSRPGKENPNYGNTWCEESRMALSINKKEYYSDPKTKDCLKYKRSLETRKKMSDHAKTRTGNKNPFYGKKHTEETIKIYREKRTGKYFGNQEKQIVINDTEYKSLSEASRKLNIPAPTILWRIRSGNKKFERYKYK